MPTHAVFNTVDALQDYSLFDRDPVLKEGISRLGAGGHQPTLDALGRELGREEVISWGSLANQYPPVLRTHDRQGRRLDSVDYHPSYHGLMELSVRHGLHSLPWEPDAAAGGHAARTALFYMAAQNELGHGCPISMTFSVVPVLRRQPELAKEWLTKISRSYDPRLLPASEKKGVIFGMAMTEKQGGSDVRANTTVARPVASGGGGQEYRLTGHKFFCSAPMSDAFCVLAQAPGGLSCFLVPRFRPDGSKNNLYFQRLKDKLGNRSNASSEVEYDDSSGWLIGEEGRGVPVIIDMVNHTRLDCCIGAAGIMRAALVQAYHHSTRRSAFGKTLVDQPLMRNVLADLTLEWEASLQLVLRLAQAFDRQEDAQALAFRRIATPVAKYWLCKRVVSHTVEALECLGGGGYVEESPMPRLFRESPLYSIWEGSGNVIGLDVLRALSRSPESLSALVAELEGSGDPRIERGLAELKEQIRQPAEADARRLVESFALLLQGSLMRRFSPEPVAEAWLRSRLGGEGGRLFGTLPRDVDTAAILARTWAA